MAQIDYPHRSTLLAALHKALDEAQAVVDLGGPGARYAEHFRNRYQREIERVESWGDLSPSELIRSGAFGEGA